MNLKRSYNAIIKKTGIEDREYAKDFLTNEIYQNPKLPIVLGAGTSSGKTMMALIKLIMFYLNPKNNNKKTLVIPAFQEILRDNFVEQLKEIRIQYGVLPFKYKIIKGSNSKQQIKEAMDSDVNVIVCLPTTINNNSNLLKNKIEWLYVDEAQYYYLAKMCQDMIKVIKPKYQLLMTGSVAKYNAESNKYIMKYVPVAELHKLRLVSNPRIELVQSSYNLKDADYKSMFGNLRDGKTNGIAKNIESLYSVATEMVKTLKSKYKWEIGFNTRRYSGKKAVRIFGDMDKTIMVCHSIPQAKCFYKILNVELKGKVLISHSQTEREDWDNFNKFKTDNSKLLIVVNQGRIGFSMKELFNIVDFSMSKDFEIIQQMVGRLLRISEINVKKQKIYFKVSTTDLAKWYEYVMRCVMCLMNLEWYSTYKGDKKQFKFPYMVRNQNQSTNKTKSNSKTKSNNKFKISEEFPLDLDYVNYVEQNMKSEFATYAWWELKDVLNNEFDMKINRSRIPDEEIYEGASKCKVKKEFIEKYPSLAGAAKKRGIWEDVTKHMTGFIINPTTNEELAKIAKKYKLKNDFIKSDKKYASLAMRRGIWEDITKHMTKNFNENKKILATEISTGKQWIYNSINDIASEFDAYSQNISNVVTGIKKSYKGFTFKKVNK
jgi:hypothetical protein